MTATELVLFNGGPHHGDVQPIPLPLCQFIVRPVEEQATSLETLFEPDVVPLPRRARYIQAPCVYTARSPKHPVVRFTTWIYDYVGPA